MKEDKLKKWECKGYTITLKVPNSFKELDEMIENGNENLILNYKDEEISRFNIEDGDIIDQVEEEIVKHYYNYQ